MAIIYHTEYIDIVNFKSKFKSKANKNRQRPEKIFFSGKNVNNHS